MFSPGLLHAGDIIKAVNGDKVGKDPRQIEENLVISSFSKSFVSFVFSWSPKETVLKGIPKYHISLQC